MKLIQDILEKNNISHEKWMTANIIFATKTGSIAYEVTDQESDVDIYAVTIPPKSFIYPDKQFIVDFDHQPNFSQWQNHHLSYNDVTYDISIFNIVKYINLLLDSTPNILDTLFISAAHNLSRTQLGNLFLERSKRIFVTKKVSVTYGGYASSQIKDISRHIKLLPIIDKYPVIKKEYLESDQLNPGILIDKYGALLYNFFMDDVYKIGYKELPSLKRTKSTILYGYDVKAAYHSVRLLESGI